MISLHTLLVAHNEHCPRGSLRNNLGDGYLLAHNPVYALIRKETVAAGFRFSSNRFEDYDVLALTQLPRILKQKIIPYRDNVRPLRKIEALAPHTFTFAQVPALVSNRLFHESAHAVVSNRFRKVRSHFKSAKERTLFILLQESFANACESLANVYSTTTIHDEFLNQNSYIMENQKHRASIHRCLVTHGRQQTFSTLVWSFLFANYLRTGKQAQAASPFLDSPAKKAVMRVGLDLDPEFTQFTNAFCLRLAGLDAPLSTLLDFDFVKFLLNRSTLLDLLSLEK